MVNPTDPLLENIDGDSYQLAVSYPVKFGWWLKDLQFDIPAGTITDLASIPWWGRWICDRASLGIIGPVVHDYLCDRRGKVISLQGEILQIHWFDVHLLFLILLRLDGISWSRSLAAFIGVLIGGPKW